MNCQAALSLVTTSWLFQAPAPWSRGHGLPSLPTLPDKLSSLYYPSSTKSTYCEDDYFLSLSKDRKTFKPIRVCEL